MRVRGETTRLPIHGKIKAGVKGGTQGRKSIDTWRFHSPDRGAIEQLAAEYGGTVTAMKDPKANPPDQWQVTTTTNLVRVWLPSTALQQASYELRDKSGRLVRRCDGGQCSVFTTGGPWEGTFVNCYCNANGRRECMPTVILDVIMPNIAPFRGVWRFITHSWYAYDEIPAMEEIIHQMQTIGIAECGLILMARSDVAEVNGKPTRRNYKVAGLQTWGENTLEQITQGAGRQAIGPGTTTHALTMGHTDDELGPDDDDQVIDAELVDEDTILVSMCDRLAYDRQLPLDGMQLLLVLARSISPDTPIEALPDIPAESWERLGEAVRGLIDGTVSVNFTPQGAKLTRSRPS
jgi:hypothetical protein